MRVLAAVAACVLVASCGDASTDIAMATDQATDVVATGDVALDQHHRTLITRTATRVTLERVSDELATTTSTILRLSPTSLDEAGDLAAVRDALLAAAGAVTDARMALERGDDLAEPREALRDARRQLESLAARLGPPR